MKRGASHWNAKLNSDDVRLIRSLVAERERLLKAARQLNDRAIAEKFDVHPNTVWRVCTRETWKTMP